MFLIDTDILSALRKRQRNPHVVQWMLDQRMTDLYLSVVSLGEIERGITQQRHRDPTFAHVLTSLVRQRARVVPHADSRR